MTDSKKKYLSSKITERGPIKSNREKEDFKFLRTSDQVYILILHIIEGKLLGNKRKSQPERCTQMTWW